MSTICAISTPLAQGGISVIRISGEKAFVVGDKIFTAFGDTKVSDMQGHTCAYGRIYNPKTNQPVDDVVLTVFRAPKSYTGENTVEISCHGGIYVTKQVLRCCLENGCEMAEQGEFTKRAFINGKLSLTQAESVMELISAQGEYALQSANLTRQGKLFETIHKVSNSMVKILGELGAWVDYPEEDLPEIEETNLANSLETALKALRKILADYDNGMVIRSGVDTCIVGKPNVGKSTLMNMLLGYDRSIVTDIAGTTRDTIEETAKIGEIILRLSDTAGIHSTDDVVERAGVLRAMDKINNAGLIIAVFDKSQPLSDDDKSLLEDVKSKRLIVVLNKDDLQPCVTEDDFAKYTKYTVTISAISGEGREKISQVLDEMFSLDTYDADSTVYANERQKNCVVTAEKYLAQALLTLQSGETLDAVTVMIDYAANCLLELTGEKATEAVVDEVFSKFCVGK